MSVNDPPVADAGSDQSALVNEDVQFDGSGSNDPDGNIESYDWDFGDGSTGGGETTSHAYDSAGDYTATLTVTDNDGYTDEDTASVSVNDPPVADAGSDKTGYVGERTQFNGTGSTDPEECPNGGECKSQELPEKGLARIDSGGVVHLVWNTGNGIYYKHSTEPLESPDYGNWSTSVNITEGMTPPGNGKWRGYDLAIGPNDTVHVAWAGGPQTGTAIDDNDVYYANSSSGWNGQKFYNDSNELRSPDIEVGSDGVVHMAWFGWCPNGKMFYTNSSSSLSNVDPVLHSDNDEKKLTDLELDQNNKPHIVWTRGDGGWPPSSADIYYSSGYNWSAEKVFGSGDNRHATLNMDSSGGAYVFFQHETSYGWDIFYANSSSNWGTETLVEDGSGADSAVTSNDDQFLMWNSDRYGDQDVFWMNLSSREVWTMVSNEHSQSGSSIFTDSSDRVFGLFRGDDTGSWKSYLSRLPGMRYKWHFGDGLTDPGAFASHAYSSSGLFYVMLEVTDSNGLSDTDNITVTVYAKPVSDPNGPYFSEVDEGITFNGSNSYDQDGNIENYSWDFGDNSTGSGETTSHTYNSTGTYTATLTVTDNDGFSSSNSTQTAVVSPPVSDPGGPYSGYVNESVQFNGTGSYDSDGVIESYVWDFGDGTIYPDDLTGECSSTGGQCSSSEDVGKTRCNDGTPEECVEIESTSYMCCSEFFGDYVCSECGYTEEYCLANDDEPFKCSVSDYVWNETDACNCMNLSKPVHSYDSTGNYTVTLNVTDDDGLTSTNQTNAIIYGLPVAVFKPKDQAVHIDKEAFFDGSESYSLSGDIVSFEWDFNDGNSSSGETTTHTYDSRGIYHPSLTVKDESGGNGSDSGIVTVFDPNACPELFLETSLRKYEADCGEIVNLDGVIRNTGRAVDATVSFWKNCINCPYGELLEQEQVVVDSSQSSYKTVSYGIEAERDSDYCIHVEGEPSEDEDCELPEDEGCKSLDVQGEVPSANLSVSPSEGDEGQEFELNASESTASSGIDHYDWDFEGNGEFTNTTDYPVRSYDYLEAGVFNPTVKVVGNQRCSDTASDLIEVYGSDGIDLSAGIKEVSETSLDEGDLFRMTVKAANVGNESLSGGTRVVIRDDENRTLESIPLEEEGLTAGSSVEVSREWKIDETEKISIEIDPDDNVPEPNENNNRDFIDEQLDVNSLPIANIKVEPSNYIDFNKNKPNKNKPVFHFSSRSYDKEEHTIVSYFWDLGDGESSTSESFSHKYITNTEKTYIVSLTVTDSDGATRTDDTQVGVGIKPVFMLPDLQMQGVDVPSIVTVNQSTKVTSVIENSGKSPAGSFDVSIETSIEEGEGERNSKTVSEGLSPGERTRVSFDWKPEEAGEYNVIVEASGGFREMDAGNNKLSQKVSVQERPTVREVGGVPEYPVAALVSMLIVIATLGYVISSGKTIKES